MFCYYTKLGANGLNRCNYCRSSCHQVASDFFTTNAPNPPHWTLNSCLCASHSVSVYLAIFCDYTELGAKRVELVQLMHNFVPRSDFGIFRNECTRPTPLDPKLMYFCVSKCLGVFWIVSLLHEAWCKMGSTGAINAKFLATKSHRNLSQRMHPAHSIGP